MKRFLLFFILLLSVIQLRASHLMGGEITARHLGGFDYEVTLTLYRDANGIMVENPVTINIMNDSGVYLNSIQAPMDTSISGMLMPGFPYPIEIYVYKQTFSVPGTGTYILSYENCCRNAAILNLPNPSGNGMMLPTKLFVDTISNSTPVFLAPPVFFCQVNTPWQYNPLPFDADGDSLKWSLSIPLDMDGLPVVGYTLPPADTSGPFKIDSITGAINWTPNTLGNFVTSVLVQEYRNGVLIGYIIRDMQMIVVADTSQVAKISNMGLFPLNTQGYPSVELPANQLYHVTLLASDPDPAEDVTIEAYGEPFLFVNNFATFTTHAKSKGNGMYGDFTWTPVPSMVRDKPYLVMFRVWGGYYSYDETILIKVVQPLGITEKPNVFSIGNVYPNPVNSTLFIPVNLDKNAEISIGIYNIIGVQIQQIPATFLEAGNRLLSANINLKSGQYFVRVERDGITVKTQKITVIR